MLQKKVFPYLGILDLLYMEGEGSRATKYGIAGLASTPLRTNLQQSFILVSLFLRICISLGCPLWVPPILQIRRQSDFWDMMVQC